MEGQGYEESTIVSNVKLIAGTIAVVAAVYSHFGVGEFPASRPQVLACVAAYIACSLLITLTSFALEASAIFVGQLTTRSRQVSKRKIPQSIWVHTMIGGKGTSAFRVQLRTSVRGKQNASEDSFPYERYFSTEGVFAKDVFRQDMQTTLERVSSESSKKSQ